MLIHVAVKIMVSAYGGAEEHEVVKVRGRDSASLRRVSVHGICKRDGVYDLAVSAARDRFAAQLCAVKADTSDQYLRCLPMMGKG
jgi:hypothetical protein